MKETGGETMPNKFLVLMIGAGMPSIAAPVPALGEGHGPIAQDLVIGQGRGSVDAGHTPTGTWHLLTVSYGGTASLISGLTKELCEKTRDKVKSAPCIDDDGGKACGELSDKLGRMKSAQCFE